MAANLTPEQLAQAEALASWAVLVPIPVGTKGPSAKGWNTDPQQWISTPSAAREYLTSHAGAGLGLLHSESQTATLDLDHEGAAAALAAVGIDLQALIKANPYRVNGRRPNKPVYRVPDGLSLNRKALVWPDPSGKKGPGGRPAPLTIFELRGGPIQDVMPPSIHPVTKQPYTWAGPVPERLSDLPELPPELLSLWQRWGVLEPVLKAACPWASADPESVTAPSPRDLNRLGSLSAAGGESVISTFNEARALGDVLGMFGYKGPPHGPWLYPHSTSGQAGVRLRPERTPNGAQVVMSWHAGDPLGDGLPRDAFAVWALLGEGVDLYTATNEQRREVVKKAARFLGLPEPERGSASSTPAPRGSSELPAADWGEVAPLPPFTEAVPSLPPEMLPSPLADWLQDEARASGLPLEMVAAPVLAGAGGLIGRRLLLRNAPNTPALPANLWEMHCAPPGARKSYAVKLGAAALERAERAEFDRLEAQRGELETRLSKAQAQLEGLEGQMKRAFKGGKNAPDAPSDDELTAAREELKDAEAALKPLRFAVSDSTIEKLGLLLGDNPQGLTLVRDELTAWLGSFERSGREADRASWLELANGDAVLRVDRMSRETLYVRGASVGVLGSIQPGPLGKMLEELSGSGDGLLQRFQLFIWPDVYPEYDQNAQRVPLDPQLSERAAAVLDALPSLTLEALGSTYPSGGAAPLSYTPAAQAIYDAWEVEHEKAKRDAGTSEAYRSHISKQSGTFARLALTFHALDVAALGVSGHPHPSRVGEESATLAALWCEYLTYHAKKLWREGRRLDVLDAKEVLRFIERGSVQDGQKVTAARAQLAQGRAGMTGARLDAALKVLEACGAVRVEVIKPATGRPSKVLRVHPDALDAGEGVGGGEL